MPLRIMIQSKNVDMDGPFRALVERRIRNAVGRFDEYIRQVTVELVGGNNPAKEKRCRIQVALNSSSELEIDEAGKDLQGVAASAIGRLGLVVFGELWRVRESGRSSRQKVESRAR